MKHGQTKCVWLFTYLGLGVREGKREREKWLPFYVWVWGEQDRDQLQMAAVRGLGAQGTPLPRNPSLTQTQTLHYSGSEPGLNPIPSLIVFPPLLRPVDIGLPEPRRQLYLMGRAESQPSLLGPGGSARVSQKWAKGQMIALNLERSLAALCVFAQLSQRSDKNCEGS